MPCGESIITVDRFLLYFETKQLRLFGFFIIFRIADDMQCRLIPLPYCAFYFIRLLLNKLFIQQ